MNTFLSKFGVYFIPVCAAMLLGCASSEQDAARNIDFTPQIIQQASDLIAADPELGRQGIVVDGFKGDMRLKGAVKTPAERARAEKIVWAVKGVRSVRNELKLAGAQEPTKTPP